MVQARKENDPVYKIGCLGKINDYQKVKWENSNKLTGVTRSKF